jgi:hypothetical protein
VAQVAAIINLDKASKGAAVFGNARKGGLLGLLAKKKQKGSDSESDSNSDSGFGCANQDCAQLPPCPNRGGADA